MLLEKLLETYGTSSCTSHNVLSYQKLNFKTDDLTQLEVVPVKIKILLFQNTHLRCSERKSRGLVLRSLLTKIDAHTSREMAIWLDCVALKIDEADVSRQCVTLLF